MRLYDLTNEVEFEEVYAAGNIINIETAFTSDILSDVLANANDKDILITVQAHENTIAVAKAKNIKVIVVCSNKKIPEKMIEAAKLFNVSIVSSSLNQFEASVAINEFLQRNPAFLIL